MWHSFDFPLLTREAVAARQHIFEVMDWVIWTLCACVVPYTKWIQRSLGRRLHDVPSRGDGMWDNSPPLSPNTRPRVSSR